MVKKIVKAIRQIDELEIDLYSLIQAFEKMPAAELEDTLKDFMCQVDDIRERMEKILVRAAHD